MCNTAFEHVDMNMNRRKTPKRCRRWKLPLEGQGGPTGISRLRLSPTRCLILVQVLELATDLGVFSQMIVKECKSVYTVSLQVVLVRELLAILFHLT